MGKILFNIAVILGAILMPIGWLYSLFTFRLKWSRLNDYYKAMAISIDKLGNVVMGTLFNDLMKTKDGYEFGNHEETISKVLGVNKKLGTLKKPGRWLADILNYIDPNHVEKAARIKIKIRK